MLKVKESRIYHTRFHGVTYSEGLNILIYVLTHTFSILGLMEFADDHSCYKWKEINLATSKIR